MTDGDEMLFKTQHTKNLGSRGEQANNAQGKILLVRKFSGKVSCSLRVLGLHNTEGITSTGKKF